MQPTLMENVSIYLCSRNRKRGKENIRIKILQSSGWCSGQNVISDYRYYSFQDGKI